MVTGGLKKLKWKYAGHVIREAPQKQNKILTTWVLQEGQRRRGRLMKRWVDEIEENFGPYWVKIARDRVKWKDGTFDHGVHGLLIMIRNTWS